jgi:hypothetical protein
MRPRPFGTGHNNAISPRAGNIGDKRKLQGRKFSPQTSQTESPPGSLRRAGFFLATSMFAIVRHRADNQSFLGSKLLRLVDVSTTHAISIRTALDRPSRLACPRRTRAGKSPQDETRSGARSGFKKAGQLQVAADLKRAFRAEKH